jgi:translation initiation factor IF-3
MVGIAAGFAFAPAVSRHLPYRSATSTTYASVPSSSFSVSPVWSRAARRGRSKRGLVAVARYSSYGSDEDDDEEGGGGRNRAPEPEQDPALDIDRIQ